jgi:hypothetical protein
MATKAEDLEVGSTKPATKAMEAEKEASAVENVPDPDEDDLDDLDGEFYLDLGLSGDLQWPLQICLTNSLLLR